MYPFKFSNNMQKKIIIDEKKLGGTVFIHFYSINTQTVVNFIYL